MLLAGTLQPAPTQALEIPQLCLAGCLPEQHNAIVNLDLTSAAPAPGGGASADFTAWPEFHNGVAAGRPQPHLKRGARHHWAALCWQCLPVDKA